MPEIKQPLVSLPVRNRTEQVEGIHAREAAEEWESVVWGALTGGVELRP